MELSKVEVGIEAGFITVQADKKQRTNMNGCFIKELYSLSQQGHSRYDRALVDVQREERLCSLTAE
jgi:hypothetical protein